MTSREVTDWFSFAPVWADPSWPASKSEGENEAELQSCQKDETDEWLVSFFLSDFCLHSRLWRFVSIYLALAVIPLLNQTGFKQDSKIISGCLSSWLTSEGINNSDGQTSVCCCGASGRWAEVRCHVRGFPSTCFLFTFGLNAFNFWALTWSQCVFWGYSKCFISLWNILSSTSKCFQRD